MDDTLQSRCRELENENNILRATIEKLKLKTEHVCPDCQADLDLVFDEIQRKYVLGLFLSKDPQ